jgi:hypothetical protein
VAWDWKNLLKRIDIGKLIDVLADLIEGETGWSDVGKLFAHVATDIGAEEFTSQLMATQPSADSMLNWAQGSPGGLRNASAELQALAKANPAVFREYGVYFIEVRDVKCTERVSRLADSKIDEWLK